jgi:hypothetical protein
VWREEVDMKWCGAIDVLERALGPNVPGEAAPEVEAEAEFAKGLRFTTRMMRSPLKSKLGP